MFAATETWSTIEAADYLGCTRRTLTRYVASGKLRAHKLPGITGSYVFDAGDVRAFRTEMGRRAAQQRAAERAEEPEAP